MAVNLALLAFANAALAWLMCVPGGGCTPRSIIDAAARADEIAMPMMKYSFNVIPALSMMRTYSGALAFVHLTISSMVLISPGFGSGLAFNCSVWDLKYGIQARLAAAHLSTLSMVRL